MKLLSCLSTPKNQRRLQDRSKPSFWLGLFSALFLLSPLGAETIVMSSTTSTEQSGLFAHLLPKFREVSGITVKVVALGTGQALDVARRGDADVVFVHDRAAEDRFVSEGFAERRYDVMYNDFVLIGPASDPAGIKGKDLISALKQIASSQVLFTSRGDRSGTHAAELRFWKTAAIEPAALVGYKACGCGMGQALNIAAASGSYNVVFGLFFARFDKHLLGHAEFHELANIHEGCEIRYPCGLLHVVGHDRNRVVGLQLVHQFLDLSR
ncbi:MAG: hypothetical protein EB116_05625 [Betaproteobacteria bacterium]|nr:hypothetical protein [Betaproteobacteria bacterium]